MSAGTELPNEEAQVADSPLPSTEAREAAPPTSPARKRYSISSSSAVPNSAVAGARHATASATTTAATAGIQVVQPSTYLGTYVRPRGQSRPMTPQAKPLTLVDREQIEALVSAHCMSEPKGLGVTEALTANSAPFEPS